MEERLSGEVHLKVPRGLTGAPFRSLRVCPLRCFTNLVERGCLLRLPSSPFPSLNILLH